ncbi:MAG: asparaginase [Solirubrobacterales bacterium]
MADRGDKPAILVISLGGTIAMTPTGEGDGVSPTLDGDDLVAAIEGIGSLAEIRTLSFERMPGAHLGFDDVIRLAERIRSESGSVDGVVVTQGTDTIEETAFALDLLLDGEAPVVVTGAMRNPAAVSADGAANLLGSIRVAASREARGLGVVVVINDEVHAARFVRKTHSSSLAAFSSTPGLLGSISEGVPQIVLRPVNAVSLPSPPDGTPVPVALITMSLGDDGRMLAALPELGYGGVVVEALGGGHVQPPVAGEIERLTDVMPVVFTSRTGRGSALERTYDFDGSELDLRRRGAIPGGWLNGSKARVLLALLLRAGAGIEVITATFARFAERPAALA